MSFATRSPLMKTSTESLRRGAFAFAPRHRRTGRGPGTRGRGAGRCGPHGPGRSGRRAPWSVTCPSEHPSGVGIVLERDLEPGPGRTRPGAIRPSATGLTARKGASMAKAGRAGGPTFGAPGEPGPAAEQETRDPPAIDLGLLLPSELRRGAAGPRPPSLRTGPRLVEPALLAEHKARRERMVRPRTSSAGTRRGRRSSTRRNCSRAASRCP